MKITYDPEVDALYVLFLDDERVEVTTQRLSQDVAIDYGSDGRIVGLEVLDASEHVFRPGSERTVTVHNLTPIKA